MPTELEKTLTTALRERAAEVPHSPMPRLGATARRGRLLPVAAAVVAAATIGAAAVVLVPDAEEAPPAVSVAPPSDPYTLRPGEVYYLRTVRSNPTGDVLIEDQVWQSPKATGPWLTSSVAGASVRDGRVVPTEPPVEEDGTCWPDNAPDVRACEQPGSWSNPNPAFLAAAPRDPAVIARQLRARAVADAKSVVDEHYPAEVALSEAQLKLRQLAYVEMAMSGNGMPPDLRAPLREFVASLPGVEVVENAADSIGRRGTGYRLGDPTDDGILLIFDGDTFLGNPLEAWVHGVAPAIGAPPSRMLS